VQITDSVALVTGGAIRVGKAFALHLASLGAHIAFTYYDEEEDWRSTQSEIEALGVRCLPIRMDIRNSVQIKQAIGTIEDTFGKLDILINNAGIWLKTPFLEIPESDLDQELAINFKGPFLLSQQAAPVMMKNRRGVIINITDISAFQVWPGYAHHAASKSALVSLTKYMAFELAPSIRVNAIAPGTILLGPNASKEKIDWSIGKSLLKRIGTVEEAAKLVEFIIQNDFVTGGIYNIDGGRSLV